MSAYLDASVLLPTLIAEPSTEAVFDCLGAGDRELLISDFAAADDRNAQFGHERPLNEST